MRLLKTIRNKIKRVAKRLKSKFDALGSYTGSADDGTKSKRPEQDADDL